MDITKIKQAVTFAVGRTGLLAKKHSPELLLGAGLVGFGVTAYLLFKAARYHEGVVACANEEIEQVKSFKVEEHVMTPAGEQQYKIELAKSYGRAGMHYVRAYGPAAATGATSLFLILASHGIMRGRNAALTSAYVLMAKSFADYRARVTEQFGEEVDTNFNLGLKQAKEKIISVDPATGIKTKTKNIVLAKDEKHKMVSPYAKFFDEYCANWRKDPHANLLFLRAQQNWANNTLIARGHLFLNEVYDNLGIPRTPEGALVGWVYNNPNGDNVVDFGLYTVRGKDLVNGYERSILLDFNVDGVIFDKIT